MTWQARALDELEFQEMMKEFLWYYKEYLKNLPPELRESTTSGLRNELTKIALTFFGPTGVGKTTLVSRLLSRLSCEEFKEELDKGEADGFSKIEGNMIGHETKSMTVYPRLVETEDFFFNDMPGLKDTDQKKRAMIDTFIRFFLSQAVAKINTMKIVVVVDAAMIKEPRMTSIITQYHEVLQKMYGLQYKHIIQHLLFVVNKYNGSTPPKEIKAKLNEAALHLVGINPLASEFLKCFANNHICVDLRIHDRAAILDALKALLTKNAERHIAMHSPPKMLATLQTDGNKMHDECVRCLERNIERIRALKEQQIEDLADRITAQFGEYREQANENDKDYEDATQDLYSTRKELKQLLAQKAAFPSTLSDIDDRMVVAKDAFKIHQNALNVFEEVCGSQVTVTFRGDESVRTKGARRRDPDRHLLNLHAILPPSKDDTAWILLIVKTKGLEATLERIGASPVPSSIKYIKTAKDESVFFNSLTGENKYGVKIAVRKGNILTLSHAFDEEVTTLLYTQCPLNASHSHNIVKHELHRTVQESLQLHESLVEARSCLIQEHKDNDQVRKVLKAEVDAKISKAKAQADMNVVACRSALVHVEGLQATIKSIKEDVRRIEDDPTIPDIEEYHGLLVTYGVPSNLAQHLSDFKAFFGPVWKELVYLEDIVHTWHQQVTASIKVYSNVTFEDEADSSDTPTATETDDDW